MNRIKEIAAGNIKGAFISIVGNYYKFFPFEIPDSAEAVKDHIYSSALNGIYSPEGYGISSANCLIEMRLAGEAFCREYIEKLWAESQDAKEMAIAKGWK